MALVTRQFEAALGIVVKLRTAGYEAYLAGGCVRDLLLGREPKDFDVATSATPDVVLRMFDRTFSVGAHFGVVLVATCGGADAAGAAESALEDEQYFVTEVATFRSDGAYSDGRHPDAVRYTLSAQEDVQRRGEDGAPGHLRIRRRQISRTSLSGFGFCGWCGGS